jgi:hypothetical protein
MARSHHDNLAKTWVHSQEEDSGETQVFRTADYQFPPARGRTALGLNVDGSLVRTAPGPDDRRSIQPDGSWKVDGKKLVLNRADGRTDEFTIESIAHDKLVLRRL